MPDIAMCQHDQCSSRHLCYRYMAVYDPKSQVFLGELPQLIRHPDGSTYCRYFKPIFPGSRIRRSTDEGRQAEGDTGASDAVRHDDDRADVHGVQELRD